MRGYLLMTRRSSQFLAVLVFSALLMFAVPGHASDFVWPLGNSATPDELDTSFGSRIKADSHDFHDGLDLPASKGTPIYATRDGVIHRAGPGGCQFYRSRHLVFIAEDPGDGDDLYIVHSHLDDFSFTSLLGMTIEDYVNTHQITPDPTSATCNPDHGEPKPSTACCDSWDAVLQGVTVTQGQPIGYVGDDDAVSGHNHLHIEFRKGGIDQDFSRHPLHYLPYTDTANFSAPVLDRFNRLNDLMGARLLFGASDKNEGDLLRVEVDMRAEGQLVATRFVDFDDPTIEQAGDENAYVNNIAIEGYQEPNMLANGELDVQYGILLRNIPRGVDELIARVTDVGGNTVTSASIVVPDSNVLDSRLDFEDSVVPPTGWGEDVQGSSSDIDAVSTLDYNGDPTMALQCVDTSTSSSSHRASIDYDLDSAFDDLFEMSIEGRFNPTDLAQVDDHDNLYLFNFRQSGGQLRAAARIHIEDGMPVVGLMSRTSTGSLADLLADDGNGMLVAINEDEWRTWKLLLTRIGTDKTTAVLYVDGDEVARHIWDSTAYPFDEVRAGLAYVSGNSAASMLADDIVLTEKTQPMAVMEPGTQVMMDQTLQELVSFFGGGSALDDVLLDESIGSLVVTQGENSGSYTSQIFDAGGDVQWRELSWDNVAPSGAGVITAWVRGCDDAACSSEAFVQVGTTSPRSLLGAVAGDVRYFQYKLELQRDGMGVSPELAGVTVTHEQTTQVLHYAFEDAAGSMTFVDSSDNAEDGYCVSGRCPTAGVTGKLGSAISCDGNDDEVLTDVFYDVATTEALTVAAWIKPDDDDGDIVSQWYSSGVDDRGYSLRVRNDKVQCLGSPDGDTFVTAKSSTTLSSNGTTWYHVACSWDGSDLKVYVDGVEEDSEPLSSMHTPTNKAIRIAAGASVEDFDGEIDEVHVWSHVLNGIEIGDLAGI